MKKKMIWMIPRINKRKVKVKMKVIKITKKTIIMMVKYKVQDL